MTLPVDMPAHFHHAPTFAEVRAALGREYNLRQRFYPERVAKGRMTQAEADRQIAVVTAMIRDLEAVMAVTVPALAPSPFRWADKRQALLRELDYRRRFYPEWVAKGRMTQAEADGQIAAFEAMLALYNDGLTWCPDPPDCPAEQRRAQWRALAAELHPVHAPQQELAL